MNPKLELLTPKNSLLLLIDYQAAMYRGVESGGRTAIQGAAVAASEGAKILGIPTVFTSIWPAGNGAFDPRIAGLFPGREVIAREVPGFDALEDERVADEVKKIGRKKIVMSGLWTSMCFAFTAIHALRDGYEVYGLMDAAGDASKEAHEYGIRRMLEVGVVPTTWMPLVSEWMHDWGNSKADELKKSVYARHDALLGMG